MQLNFRQFGEATGTPLVLLHGLFGSLENVSMLARQLADDFTVYALDLPNHGRSPSLNNAGLAQYAQAISEWMAQHRLSQAHVVGHSLGGKVAMELALASPEHVNRLVVLDISPVRYSNRHEHIFNGLAAIPLGQIKSRADADKILIEHVNEAAVRSFLLKNLYREDDKFAWRIDLNELHGSYSKLVGENRQKSFDHPVLFLKGEQSNYILESHRAEVEQRFPKAQLRVVSDTEHWLHAEKPELVARLISRFLLSSI